jgi:FHS family L-fucose permease-like MFS transporter
VVGPVIAGQFIFAGNEGAMTTLAEKQSAAEAVIFPYTLIAGTVLLVAFLFFLTKMPEPAKTGKIKFDKAIFKRKHLMRAVLAQFFYVGAQAGIWGITINYIIELIPGTTKEIASQNFMAVGTFLFVVGRFLGTWLMTFVKDHKLLTVYGAVASSLCFMGVFAEGRIAVYAVLGVNFFMSIMFPTIFALGVKNLGEQHTKLGSSFIIMAIVGGAILPPLMGLVADDIGMQQSFVLPALCFLAVVYYGWSGYKIREPAS